MKGIIKSIFIFLCLFAVVFICNNASAISITSEHTGIYFTILKDNGHRFSDEMMIYKVDGQYAYCIEPGIPLGTEDYYLSDLNNMDPSLKKKIEDYMYYGYKYDREGDDYYIATQALIWESLLTSKHVVFSTELFEKGTIIDETFYKNQIINGVRVMNDNFESNNTYEMFVGDELLIENLQLNGRYNISYDTSNMNIKVRSQALRITNVNKVGIYEIDLIENDYYKSPYIVYKNNDKQDLLVLGNIIHKNKKLIINVKGGGINLKKEDHDTHELLSDTTYGLYNDKDELLYELYIDDKKEVTIDNELTIGTYYIKELKAPIGYELDDNKYYFTIDTNNRFINMIATDIKIEGNLIINKYDKDTNEVIPDTYFNIMDEEDEIIDTVKTDDKGKAIIKLKYGKYKYQEIKNNDNYELDDTIYDINIDKSDNYIVNVYNNKIPEEDELIITDVPNTNAYSILPLLLVIGVIIVKEETYYYILNH